MAVQTGCAARLRRTASHVIRLDINYRPWNISRSPYHGLQLLFLFRQKEVIVSQHSVCPCSYIVQHTQPCIYCTASSTTLPESRASLPERNTCSASWRSICICPPCFETINSLEQVGRLHCQPCVRLIILPLAVSRALAVRSHRGGGGILLKAFSRIKRKCNVGIAAEIFGFRPYTPVLPFTCLLYAYTLNTCRTWYQSGPQCPILGAMTTAPHALAMQQSRSLPVSVHSDSSRFLLRTVLPQQDASASSDRLPSGMSTKFLGLREPPIESSTSTQRGGGTNS